MFTLIRDRNRRLFNLKRQLIALLQWSFDQLENILGECDSAKNLKQKITRNRARAHRLERKKVYAFLENTNISLFMQFELAQFQRFGFFFSLSSSIYITVRNQLMGWNFVKKKIFALTFNFHSLIVCQYIGV